MNFGQALEIIKQGGKVARKGWNGKGIYLGLHQVKTAVDAQGVKTPTVPIGEMTHDYIYIDTTGLQTDNPDAPKDRVPWLASQTDMLAEDWYGIGKSVVKPVEGTLKAQKLDDRYRVIQDLVHAGNPRSITVNINNQTDVSLEDLEKVLQRTNKNQADYLVKSLAAIHDYTNPVINYPGMEKSESGEDDG